ncbi:MAG: hypothetical protein R3C62_19920 [Chloroflexota bacterium]
MRHFLIATLLLCLAACSSQPQTTTQITPVGTITAVFTPPPSLPATPTNAPRQTATSSSAAEASTPVPSIEATPQPTSTPTPYQEPSPTPLVPTPQPAATYHLVPWTLEQADQLIAMLEVYADDLLKGQAGYHDSGIRYIIEA